MYVTRPLSIYRSSPEAARTPPPPGPGSGYLVFQDEEYEAQATCCSGLCASSRIRSLPLPQDRRLRVECSYSERSGYSIPLFFIPVVDVPLSSAHYYAIVATGSDAGKIYTCTPKCDINMCHHCSHIDYAKPSEFDHNNLYQQLKLIGFTSKSGPLFIRGESVALDAIPPTFLNRNGLSVCGSKKHVHRLTEASGIDESLRARLPATDFSGVSSPPVVVGKWYSPFIFVKEEKITAAEQVKTSFFYEMTMEQAWEELYECRNHLDTNNVVNVSLEVETQRVMLGDEEIAADQDDSQIIVNGVKWFKREGSDGGGVGLNMVIVERMKWEEARGGWVEEDGVVEIAEELEGKEWDKFRCFVLVERFVLRRTTDGSSLLTFVFKHTNKLKFRWELGGASISND